MEKILVLADNYPIAIGCVIPYLDVRSFVQAEVNNMVGPVAVRAQEAANDFRKLVVHQEIHVLVSTT